MTSAATEIDIVILSAANTENLRKITETALVSLQRSESRSEVCFNTVIIESNHYAAPYVYRNTKTIYPKTSFSYNRYLALGISKGKASYVCLCNNDLIFKKNWAKNILSEFKSNPDLKSASPICTILRPRINLQIGFLPIYGYDIRRHVLGWCIFVKREVFEIIGMPDPRFKFWYADNDFAMLLKSKNLLHALIPTAEVDHLGSQTLSTKGRAESIELTTMERYYYEYKWCNRSYNSYRYYRQKLRKVIYGHAK